MFRHLKSRLRKFFRTPRRIYVDLGANKGKTVERFLGANPDWHVYAFEPAPQLAKRLRRRFRSNPKVVIIQAAVADRDGEALFYPGLDSDQSSTLLTGKTPGPKTRVDYDHGYEVRSVDFAAWLRQNTTRRDEIIIKMDIEGAEYAVLPRLLATRSLLGVKELRVEWHQDRFSAISVSEHDQLREAVGRVVKLVNWH